MRLDTRPCAVLCRERHSLLPVQRTRNLGEDREVGVKLHAPTGELAAVRSPIRS